MAEGAFSAKKSYFKTVQNEAAGATRGDFPSEQRQYCAKCDAASSAAREIKCSDRRAEDAASESSLRRRKRRRGAANRRGGSMVQQAVRSSVAAASARYSSSYAQRCVAGVSFACGSCARSAKWHARGKKIAIAARRAAARRQRVVPCCSLFDFRACRGSL